jgi:DnaJ-class molecular chaperone
MSLRKKSGKCCLVDKVVLGSPSDKNGIRRGDTLVAIGGLSVRAFELDKVVDELAIRYSSQGILLTIERDAEVRGWRFFGGEDLPSNQLAMSGASCYLSLPRGDDCVSYVIHGLLCKPALDSKAIPAGSAAATYALSLPDDGLDGCQSSPQREAGNTSVSIARVVSRGGNCTLEQKVQNAVTAGAQSLLVMLDPAEYGSAVSLPQLGGHPLKQDTFPIPVLAVANGVQLLGALRSSARPDCIRVALSGGDSHREKGEAGRAAQDGGKSQSSLGSALDSPDDPLEMHTWFAGGDVYLTRGEPGMNTQKMDDVFLQLEMDLVNVVSGLNTTITVDQQIVCPHCHGRGANPRDLEPCSLCKASSSPGTLLDSSTFSPDFGRRITTTCPSCHGYGEAPRQGSRPCRKCGGKRVLEKHQTEILLNLPKGASDGHMIVYPQFSHFPNRPPGRLVVSCHFRPHENFTRDGNSLRTNVSITLSEALGGFRRDLVHLNGSLVTLERTNTTFHGQEIVIAEAGLPAALNSEKIEDCSMEEGAEYGSEEAGNAVHNCSALNEGEEPPYGPMLVKVKVVFPAFENNEKLSEEY